jgi:hypothetical protein
VSAPEDQNPQTPQEADPKAASPADEVATEVLPPAAGSSGDSTTAEKHGRGVLYWVLLVLVLLGVELYYYGSKGDIKVCVAKEGAHDFGLIGKERTDANRWKFPFCEDRVNLGLRSHYDEMGREAVKVACRRATLMHFKDEQGACNSGDKNWKRKVTSKQIPPWDRRFYRRLFLLDR